MAKSIICPLPNRGVLQITGPDARDFLQNLITNDMGRVSPDCAIYAALLTPQGKYLFDFFVAQLGGGETGSFLLDCEAARSADLAKRLGFYKLRAKLAISDLSNIMGVAAYLGPEGRRVTQCPEQPGAAIQWPDGVVFTDPRLPDMGARAILPVDAIARLGGEIPVQAYDRLRLEFGLTDGARDIQVDKYFLLEASFEELNGVDFKKGCYVGQELVSRMKHRDAVRKRILPVVAHGPLPAPGTPILSGSREAGTLLSGLANRALAYLRLEYLSNNAPPLMADGVELTLSPPQWLAGKLNTSQPGENDDAAS